MDQETIDRAAEAADRAAPAPSITDTMPVGAARVGATPATPINAATMRFLQAIQHALGEDLSEDEAGFFVLYCRIHGATREGRSDLWRRARSPLKLWEDFQGWMFATDSGEFAEMVKDHAPDFIEVAEAQEILGAGGDGGPEGNAIGSQSS